MSAGTPPHLASRRHWLRRALAVAGTATAWPGRADAVKVAKTSAPETTTTGTAAHTSLPPAPQQPRPWRPPPIFEQRLANGVTVLTVPRAGLPLVSAQLLLRVGAAADPSGQPGLAMMTTGLLAKGARRAGQDMGAVALARQAEALGATLDSSSGWHRSSLAVTVATPQLPAALALLCDLMRRPLLAQAELERARAQALDQWALSMASPDALSGLLLQRVFWGAGTYGALATAQALQRLTRSQLLRFHAQHYRPQQLALVLAGDITPEVAAVLAQRLLADWPATPASRPTPADALPAAAPLAPAGPAASLNPALWLLHMPGSGQCAVNLAAPFVAEQALDADNAWPVGLVSNAVLGGGYSARLNQAIRIRRGLSYGAFSNVQSLPQGGMLNASATTSPDKAAQVLQLIRDELARLADSPPPADELAARQANLVGSLARQLDTSSGLASWVAEHWLHHRALGRLADQAERLLAVRPDQVMAFAARHWADAAAAPGAGRQRAVVAGDIRAGGQAWAGTVAQRLTLAELDLDRLGLAAAR